MPGYPNDANQNLQDFAAQAIVNSQSRMPGGFLTYGSGGAAPQAAALMQAEDRNYYRQDTQAKLASQNMDLGLKQASYPYTLEMQKRIGQQMLDHGFGTVSSLLGPGGPPIGAGGGAAGGGQPTQLAPQGGENYPQAGGGATGATGPTAPVQLASWKSPGGTNSPWLNYNHAKEGSGENPRWPVRAGGPDGPNQLTAGAVRDWVDAHPGAVPDTEHALLSRRDPEFSHGVTLWYAGVNGKALADNGFPVTGQTLMVAHRFGARGAMNLLSQDPDTPMAKAMPGVIPQNPQYAKMTVGQAVGEFADAPDLTDHSHPTRDANTQGGALTAHENYLQDPDTMLKSALWSIDQGMFYSRAGYKDMAAMYQSTGERLLDTWKSIVSANQKPEALRPGSILAIPRNASGQTQVILQAPDIKEGRGAAGQPEWTPVWPMPGQPGAPPMQPGSAGGGGGAPGGGGVTPARPVQPASNGTGAAPPPLPSGPPNLPPASPGSVAKGLPPGALEEQKKSIDEFRSEAESKRYAAAQSAKSQLADMEHGVDVLNQNNGWNSTGQFAEERLGFTQFISGIRNSLGLQPDAEIDKKLTAGQMIEKATMRLAFDLGSAYFGGSREAAQTIQNLIAANPGLHNTPQGIKALMASVREMAQRIVDRHMFVERSMIKTSMGPADAASTFDSAWTPEMYAKRGISQYAPFKVSDPSELAKLMPGTRYRGPDGKVRKVTGPESIAEAYPVGQ